MPVLLGRLLCNHRIDCDQFNALVWLQFIAVKKEEVAHCRQATVLFIRVGQMLGLLHQLEEIAVKPIGS